MGRCGYCACNDKLIVAAVLLVGILFPAFGEEIQNADSVLIGTWELREIASVGQDFPHDGEGLNLVIETYEENDDIFSISLELDGLGKSDLLTGTDEGERIFWCLLSYDRNRLLMTGLSGGAILVLVPMDENTFLVLTNTMDLSGLAAADYEIVIYLTMTRVSETDE